MAVPPTSSDADLLISRSASQASHSQVEFAGELKRSGLLSHSQFVDVITLCKQHIEPTTTARQLVQEGLLTGFQAGQILMGQGQWLSLGNYQVQRPLGEGGVGRIYLGRDRRDNRTVAIKMLRESRRKNPRAVQRFHVEGRALLSLQHKNLLRGLSFQTANPQRQQPAYLVTEFVEGPNLRELLAIRKELPCGVVCDMISQAAAGLQYAHQHRFIHRDIKPSNLMALASGRVRVIDFGMVRFCGNDPELYSPPPAKLGFADFLAPEQLADRENVDQRADIYSLGCTLYYLLTGYAPIKFAPRNAPPPALAERRPDAPAELQQILERMLAVRPADRFATMAEVQEHLLPLSRRASLIIDYPALLRARTAALRSAAVHLDGTAPAERPSHVHERPSGVPMQAETQLQTLERIVADLTQRLMSTQQALADTEAKLANDARIAAQQMTLWRAEKEKLQSQLELSESRRLATEQQLQALLARVEASAQRAIELDDEVSTLEFRLSEEADDAQTLRKAYDEAKERQDDK